MNYRSQPGSYIEVESLEDVSFIPNPDYDEALNILREANSIEPDPQDFLLIRRVK